VSLHQQLLAELDRHDPHGLLKLGKALRAVVELHPPAADQPQLCRTCWDEIGEDYRGYPCETVLAIARELGIEASDHG